MAYSSQAMQENTRAREILKQAPFLVPFTSRVKIFAVSELHLSLRTQVVHVYVINPQGAPCDFHNLYSIKSGSEDEIM